MRAAFSILGLVIVLAIVLLSARKQMQALAPQAGAQAGASSAAAATPALPVPSQVGAQVEELVRQADQRSSEAMP